MIIGQNLSPFTNGSRDISIPLFHEILKDLEVWIEDFFEIFIIMWKK